MVSKIVFYILDLSFQVIYLFKNKKQKKIILFAFGAPWHLMELLRLLLL